MADTDPITPAHAWYSKQDNGSLLPPCLRVADHVTGPRLDSLLNTETTPYQSVLKIRRRKQAEEVRRNCQAREREALKY
jgi:hypothetical protein